MTYYTKKEFNQYFLKDNFIRMNINIDFDKLGILIWPWRIIYFMKLLKSITNRNEVDLSILDLPKWTFNTVRYKFIKWWIIKKCKIWNDTVKKYYFNPIYWTNTNKINTELFNAFDIINNKKIY